MGFADVTQPERERAILLRCGKGQSQIAKGEKLVKRIVIGLALTLGIAAIPMMAQAQGIGRGAEEGATRGKRAAGPVGGVVGGVVGGAVGGAVGGVKGVLGIPQDTHYNHHYRRGRHHRR